MLVIVGEPKIKIFDVGPKDLIKKYVVYRNLNYE